MKQPSRICLANDEPLAFAGRWEHWAGDGSSQETVAILTTEASARGEPIHDRPPVMLDPDEEAAWLAADDPGSLLDPDDGDDLRTSPVSRAVTDPGNDAPDGIEPVAVDEQSGADEFGERAPPASTLVKPPRSQGSRPIPEPTERVPVIERDR